MLKNRRRRLFMGIFLILIACTVLFLGMVVYLFYYVGRTYDIELLGSDVPKLTSRIFCADGKPLGSFFDEDRELVRVEDVPEVLKQALFASEDRKFLHHHGIDYIGIVRALWADLWARKVVQGGSTLSQQLAKMKFLNQERTIKRKVFEAILALEIERNYSKEKILEIYLNNVYLGRRSYGVGSASRRYFRKPVQDITPDEAALLVSLIPSPARYSPFSHADVAKQRRNRVLGQMVELGSLGRDEATAYQNRPLGVQPEQPYGNAPYVRLEVERFLQNRFGYRLYDLQVKGLTVGTTVRCDYEAEAEKAIGNLLHEYDTRHQWRGNIKPVAKFEPPQTVETFYSKSWTSLRTGNQVEGLITDVSPAHVSVRIGSFLADIDTSRAPRVKDFTNIFHVGDVALFEIEEVDEEHGILFVNEVTLEASLVALDETGAILALVGGIDFETSNYDRVMQARRQAGSAFKPIVYTAFLETEIARGVEEPWLVRLNDARRCYRSRPKPYCPQNFKHIKPQYAGVWPALRMVTESRNAATVSVAAHVVGIKHVVDMAHRLGINASCEPYLPTAIGSCDVTLLELTNAFSTIASRGTKREPYLIEYVADNLGNVLYSREKEITDKPGFSDSSVQSRAIAPEIADLMLVGMRSVAEAGTAMKSRELPFSIAGKTGTTNDSTDAWFIGVTPEFRIGMWAGFDTKLSLGERETGGSTVLPSWMQFAQAICSDTSCGQFDAFVETKLRELMPKSGLKMKGPKERAVSPPGFDDEENDINRAE